MSPFRTSAERSGFLDRASASDSREDIPATTASATPISMMPVSHWWQRLLYKKQGGAAVQSAPLPSRDA